MLVQLGEIPTCITAPTKAESTFKAYFYACNSPEDPTTRHPLTGGVMSNKYEEWKTEEIQLGEFSHPEHITKEQLYQEFKSRLIEDVYMSGKTFDAYILDNDE